MKLIQIKNIWWEDGNGIIINFIKGILQKRNTSDVPEMSNETKNWLKEYYKEDVEKLSILLKRDLSKWAE